MKDNEEILDTTNPDFPEPVRSETLIQPLYAGITDRLKAFIADILFLVFLMMIFSAVFDSMKGVPDGLRMWAFFFIAFIYDPLFTSLFGGTIGHRLNGLRVKQELNHKKNIPIHKAAVRFFIKALLGWISVLTISASEKSAAIHDMVVQSVVIHVKK